MLVVETIVRIRREHFVKRKTIKEIARDLGVSATRSAGSGDQERHPWAGAMDGRTRRIAESQ
jgi:hypothetical protein